MITAPGMLDAELDIALMDGIFKQERTNYTVTHHLITAPCMLYAELNIALIDGIFKQERTNFNSPLDRSHPHA